MACLGDLADDMNLDVNEGLEVEGIGSRLSDPNPRLMLLLQRSIAAEGHADSWAGLQTQGLQAAKPNAETPKLWLHSCRVRA